MIASETDRLRALRSYAILDTPPEEPFDRIVELASTIFRTPTALISLIDERRQWFKARVGLDATETPREWAFCNRAIQQPPLLVVPDAQRAPDVAENPLVRGPPTVRFYAGAVISSSGGQPLGTVCVIDSAPRPDLTPQERKTLEALARLAESELERRRATMEAREAARRFQDFVETSADWYWELDADLRFATIAGNLPDMPLREEFIGRRRWEAHGAQAAPGIWDRHQADLEARRPFRDFAVEGRTRDGARIAISISGKPIFDESGVFTGYRGTSRDQTRQLEAQEALARSEENFRAVFEHHPDPMWVVDPDSLHFLLVNDAAIALYGYSREEFLAMRTPDIPVEAEQERLRGFLKQVHPLGSTDSEWRHRTKDGREIIVTMRGRAVRYDGRAARLIVARDVTALRAAEQALARQEALLNQAQRLESLGKLTGGVAHDFNTLLTVILGNAEVLQEAVAGEPGLAEVAGVTRRAAERASQLTAQLLTFARRQPLLPETIEIAATLERTVALLRRTISESIEIAVAASPELWPALVDEAQLENALLNLCIKARDAMPGGGRIEIEVRNCRLGADAVGLPGEVAPGEYVLLTVADSGSGMPPEVRERAFEPFFTTKGVGKGSGLGLSMVYGFVKQSGGHVALHSEPGRGTLVALYLPRATGGAKPAEEPRAPAATSEKGSERVLLVEDDEMVRSYAEQLLKSLGYKVVAAENGPSALAILQGGAGFDLLLTDMVMPGGIDGRELAEAARALRPDLPVLISSGYAESAIDAGEWQQAGLHLLNKPYRRRELAEKVRRILDGAAA
ncbi:MAG: PAS domain S-box protein [Caulobacteraceae bacterium]|nr:PAS domain S-box protein [Caulobacteraceae bacterium]